MYCSIVVTDNEKIRKECGHIISELGDIKVDYFSNIKEVDLNGSYLSYLFILISEININVLKEIKRIQNLSPDLSIIFYNHSLTLSGLNEVGDSSQIKLIVGENREQVLSNLIQSLKKSYWRTIPFERFQIKFDNMSNRIKKALKFIESVDIRKCNISNIAAYLDISPGYFSQEFKRETGQSFRTFMQNVLSYYEEIIFTKVNLPTKNISQLLGYSELSSFSRSFKKRKGVSPTKYKKLVKM